MRIDIITGVSIFNQNMPIVGVALKGEISTTNICKAADAASTVRGRPAATQTLSGRTEAEQIAYLVSKWVEWAHHNNIPLNINTKPRWACAF
jgi:hypothetical protein